MKKLIPYNYRETYGLIIATITSLIEVGYLLFMNIIISFDNLSS